MSDGIVGGSSTAQQLLREAEASLAPGFYPAAPRAARRYVRQALERRIADPATRARVWVAFQRCFAHVDVAAADAALGRLRLDAETTRALRDDPSLPRSSPASSPAPSEPCVTVLQAAARLGVNPEALRGRIRRGTIASFAVDRRRLIPLAEIERLAEAA